MNDKRISKTRYLNLKYINRPFIRNLNTHNPLSKNFNNITPWLNLTYVNLSDNKINILPSAFGKLRLKHLNLSQNLLGTPNLTKWPWMEQCSIRNTLISLNLSNNFLTRLPLNIGRLDNLVSLNIFCNLLKKLPQSIENMNALEVLDMCCNEFLYVPGIIMFLDKLRILDITMNPFQHPIWKNKIPSLVESSGNVILRHRFVDSIVNLLYYTQIEINSLLLIPLPLQLLFSIIVLLNQFRKQILSRLCLSEHTNLILSMINAILAVYYNTKAHNLSKFIIYYKL
ncbi:Protein lap1 [Cyphomyrmex costatus]|uniref:Protein lap1 n=1 Tax=Cyphomyrmex costatus TaxID=456900 RepID=A0A151IHV4_9HYME|nr:Protein lap1 [Cyphomyrmex costatus]